MPLLLLSRIPPRMHPPHIHASPTFRRVERITREGMGELEGSGHHPVFLNKKRGAKQKRGEGKVQTWACGIKLFFKLGIMEKQKKRIIGIGSWKLFVKEGRVMETMPGKESFGEYENQQVGV